MLHLDELIQGYKSDFTDKFNMSGSEGMDRFLLDEVTKLVGDYDTIVEDDGKYVLIKTTLRGGTEVGASVSEDTYAKYVALSVMAAEHYDSM